MYFQGFSQILIEYFDCKTSVLDFSLRKTLQSLGACMVATLHSV